MFRRGTLLAIPALALLFATACSSPAASVPTATPVAIISAAPTAAAPSAAPATPSQAPASDAPAPTATPYDVNVPASMQGMWTSEVQGSLVTSGTWTMEIIENEFLVTNPRPGSEAFPVGLTAITSDHVNFWDDSECPHAGAAKDATYTYALVNGELTFTRLQDFCAGRAGLLTNAPWVRQPE